MPTPPFTVRQLTSDDAAVMAEMMTLFGEVFDEMDTYTHARPDEAYVRRLLGSETFIALAALKEDQVVGGDRKVL